MCCDYAIRKEDGKTAMELLSGHFGKLTDELDQLAEVFPAYFLTE